MASRLIKRSFEYRNSSAAKQRDGNRFDINFVASLISIVPRVPESIYFVNFYRGTLKGKDVFRIFAESVTCFAEVYGKDVRLEWIRIAAVGGLKITRAGRGGPSKFHETQ